jgi:hypothetical protein
MTSKVNNQTLEMNSSNNQYNYNIKDNKSGRRYKSPKQGYSAKLRRTDDYWLKKHNIERRKQTKVSYNHTHRRAEQLTAKDIILEEIQFANFLGCGKVVKDGRMAYTGDVNINMCDMFKPKECADDFSDDFSDGGFLSQLNTWRQQQIFLEQQEYDRQQDEWGWMVNDCNLDYYGSQDISSDNEPYYDEEQNREDNYTKLFYDSNQKRYRIWKPIKGYPRGGRIVCESDDENSQGSCR